MSLNSIQEVFFAHLMQLEFKETDLDYTLLNKHISALEKLAELTNSGIQVFDLFKREIVFFSPNFGKQLGYSPADYAGLNYKFFEEKIHPDERKQLALHAVSLFKIFAAFSVEEKLSYKAVSEYRMLNSDEKYVRINEQYQFLELDKSGQLWLLLTIVDLSPNQDANEPVKSQLLNFKTGRFIPFDVEQKAELDLTKREKEILLMIKQGLLSKEISNKLSISVHTVNTHRQRVLEKLGANNSMEALIFASKYGLLE